jgi:hypothetical protein
MDGVRRQAVAGVHCVAYFVESGRVGSNALACLRNAAGVCLAGALDSR